MRKLSTWSLCWVGSTLAVVLCDASGAAIPTDQPAIASEDAANRLILDIARIGQRIVAVGEQGHIILSDDGGTSWVHAKVPVSAMLTAVTAIDADSLIAVGHDGVVLASTDRGDTWALKLDGRRIVTLQIDAARQKIARLSEQLDALAADTPAFEEATFALEDAQFDLEDAEAITDGGLMSPLLGATFLDDSTGFVYGAYGVILRTDDAGETWSLIAQRLENPDRKHLYSLKRSTSGALVLVGEAGALYRSVDRGETWQIVPFEYQGSLFGLIAAADDRLVTFGLRGRIFLSIDAGQSWQPVASEHRATLFDGDVTPAGDILLSGASGTLLVSRDTGASFELVDSASRDPLGAVSHTADGAILVGGFQGVRALPGVSR
ncbi:MAG: YCF48-related protein [Pseudomonadota bacterium]